VQLTGTELAQALEDYAWWSGLTVADARAGVEMAEPRLVREVRKGRAYWLIPSTVSPGRSEPGAHLLPNYDEYLIAATAIPL
jgi:hypothetical protein